MHRKKSITIWYIINFFENNVRDIVIKLYNNVSIVYEICICKTYLNHYICAEYVGWKENPEDIVNEQSG